MSYRDKKPYITNNYPQRQPQTSSQNAQKKDTDEKMIKLSRCCICFENYSSNTRAPICVPCGHSFCNVCVQKLCYGNLVCCCICRKVTFFGPKDLGKNIQLLDILEHLDLLDPDETPVPQARSSTAFPENAMEGIDGKDLIKYLEFCFNFIKKFYEHQQDNLVTQLAILHEDSQHQIIDHANRVFVARTRLSESFDSAISRFNEVCRQLDSFENQRPSFAAPAPVENQRLGYITPTPVEYMPVFDDNEHDPFGLESAASFHIFGVYHPEPRPAFTNRLPVLALSSPGDFSDDFEYDDEYLNAYNPSVDEDAEENGGFRPQQWQPLSKLFDLPRRNDRNRRY
jgi:hypothetical protein